MIKDTLKYKHIGYVVKGELEIESDGDNMKWLYSCKDLYGNPISLDWSPYSKLTIEDFRFWIQLGCPARIGMGPLDRLDLLKIQEKLL